MKLVSPTKKILSISALSMALVLGACSPGKLWKKAGDTPEGTTQASSPQPATNTDDKNDSDKVEAASNSTNSTGQELRDALRVEIREAVSVATLFETIQYDARNEEIDAVRPEMTLEQKTAIEVKVANVIEALITEAPKGEKNQSLSGMGCALKFAKEYGKAYSAKSVREDGTEGYTHSPVEALKVALQNIGLEIQEDGQCGNCQHNHAEHGEEHGNNANQ